MPINLLVGESWEVTWNSCFKQFRELVGDKDVDNCGYGYWDNINIKLAELGV
jgi:hypothetical protein